MRKSGKQELKFAFPAFRLSSFTLRKILVICDLVVVRFSCSGSSGVREAGLPRRSAARSREAPPTATSVQQGERVPVRFPSIGNGSARFSQALEKVTVPVSNAWKRHPAIRKIKYFTRDFLVAARVPRAGAGGVPPPEKKTRFTQPASAGSGRAGRPTHRQAGRLPPRQCLWVPQCPNATERVPPRDFPGKRKGCFEVLLGGTWRGAPSRRLGLQKEHRTSKGRVSDPANLSHQLTHAKTTSHHTALTHRGSG